MRLGESKLITALKIYSITEIQNETVASITTKPAIPHLLITDIKVTYFGKYTYSLKERTNSSLSLLR